LLLAIDAAAGMHHTAPFRSGCATAPGSVRVELRANFVLSSQASHPGFVFIIVVVTWSRLDLKNGLFSRHMK
jgi:hypothetical protein